MAKEPKKLALLRIWQILREDTDINHPITQAEIIDKLEKDYGIQIDRKTVSNNISLLEEAGIEIGKTKEGSYLSFRKFDDSELRLLIDGVLSSKYINAKQSKDLIERICTLSSKYFHSHVKHIYSVEEWIKTDNQAIFLNISIIDEAIEEKKQIRYEYNRYGIDKKMHKSSTQQVTPYMMLIHNQGYYVMAYSEYWSNMVFHRLDHITNIQVLYENAYPMHDIPGYENGINYKELASSMPYMYTDRPKSIVLIADIRIIDQIIEWFGKDVKITKTDSTNKVRVVLKASPNAMVHWAMQYINYVEILSPQSLRERVRVSLQEGIEKYR